MVQSLHTPCLVYFHQSKPIIVSSPEFNQCSHWHGCRGNKFALSRHAAEPTKTKTYRLTFRHTSYFYFVLTRGVYSPNIRPKRWGTTFSLWGRIPIFVKKRKKTLKIQLIMKKKRKKKKRREGKEKEKEGEERRGGEEEEGEGEEMQKNKMQKIICREGFVEILHFEGGRILRSGGRVELHLGRSWAWGRMHFEHARKKAWLLPCALKVSFAFWGKKAWLLPH